MIATIMMIVASVAVIVYRPSDGRAAAPPVRPLPTEPLSFSEANTKGSVTAKFVLMMYSDFECQFCGRFAKDTLPALEAKYVATGQILLAFINLPLPNHKFAKKAAEAAECAGKQGLFWEVHDAFFKQQDRLDVLSLRKSAGEIGVRLDDLDRCLASELVGAKVQRDADSAASVKVNATPFFYIGSIGPAGVAKVVAQISGAAPIADFEKTLDRTLHKR